MDQRFERLQQRLSYRFAQPALLQRALTHRSAGPEHNERLEFLGDAVLNLAVSTLLYERFGDSDEGELTRIRAHLVREDSLHRTALTLDLPALVWVSDAEARGGGAQRPSILADAVEALLGAIMVDGGFAPAQEAVRRLFGELIDSSEVTGWTKDAKTELQELLQARRIAVPDYRIVATRGQAHDQTFDVECAVPALKRVARGEGRSRRAAEQDAAGALLQALRAPGKPAANET